MMDSPSFARLRAFRVVAIIVMCVLLAVGYIWKVREIDLTSEDLSRTLRYYFLTEIPELSRKDLRFYSYADCSAPVFDLCAGATFDEKILKEPVLVAKIINSLNAAPVQEKIVINIVRNVPYSKQHPEKLMTITRYQPMNGSK